MVTREMSDHRGNLKSTGIRVRRDSREGRFPGPSLFLRGVEMTQRTGSFQTLRPCVAAKSC